MVKFIKPMRILGVACTTIVLLSGCSTGSIFTPYPKQAAAVRQDILSGQFKRANANLAKKKGSQDKILYLMEEGRVEQLAGNYKVSEKAFAAAIYAVDANRDKAKYTVTGGAAQASSLLVNDNVIPYKGYPYEHIMLHQYQALNYLAMGNISGALVEVRVADQEQSAAKERHDKALYEAEKKAKGKKITNKVNWQQAKFKLMNAAAAKVKSQFLNAYTYYFGGLLYQADGKINDAYIDYKLALGISPKNVYLQQTVMRFARQLDMTNDLAVFNKIYKGPVPLPKANQGEVVVIYEQGFIPPRKQIMLPIPSGAGIVTIAIPIYDTSWQNTSPLTVAASGKALGATQAIVNFQALAAKALKENMPVIVTRMVLRAIAKGVLEHEAAKEDNPLVSILTNVYAWVSTAADLRSWLTLPNDVQIMHAFVDKGERKITLSAEGQRKTVSVRVVPGHISIVWVAGYSNKMYNKVFFL